jgi:hypothetical protein
MLCVEEKLDRLSVLVTNADIFAHSIASTMQEIAFTAREGHKLNACFIYLAQLV